MSLQTVFNHQLAAAMKDAYERAWMTLASNHDAQSPACASMKETLASAILDVASDGVRDPQAICELALQRLPIPVSLHVVR